MEKKRLNNEGFSLIELIIVIAIMAILVGALAPQLVKYIERSRVSADKQAIGALYTAVQTAIMDPTSNPKGATSVGTSLSSAVPAATADDCEIVKSVIVTLGGDPTATGVHIYDESNGGLVKLTSKAYKGASVTVSVSKEYAVTITVPSVGTFNASDTDKGFTVTASGAVDNTGNTALTAPTGSNITNTATTPAS